MSSSPRGALRAIFLLLALPFLGFSQQGAEAPIAEVSSLLLADAILEAEAILDSLPEDADVLAFKGEIEFRRARFDASRDYYSRALGLDPDTARAHFGLGKLSMGKVRLGEAIDSLSRAVQLAPDVAIYRLALADAHAYDGDVQEQVRELEAYVDLNPTYDPERLGQVEAVLEVINDFGSVQMGAYELSGETDRITISQGLNLIFAEVMVGGEGPFEFIVDTGASQTVFTERLLGELGLEPITSTLIYGIGGDGRVESGIYRIDELTIDGIEVQNLPVGNLSDPLLGELTDGIFSTATFSNEIVSIDYPNSVIELNAFNVAEESLGESVPGWFFSNLAFVLLRVNGDYEGLFLVDTGAVTSVLSHSTAAALGVTEDNSGGGISLGLAGIAGVSGVALPVPGVALSTEEIQASFPLMVAIDMSEISKTLGIEVAGVVGYDFLKDYRVTIDFGNAQVVFSR